MPGLFFDAMVGTTEEQQSGEETCDPDRLR